MVSKFHSRYRMGRRSAFLLLFGFIWLCIGVGIRGVEPSAVQRRGLSLITAHVPYRDLALLWVGCGLTSMVVGLYVIHRKHVADHWGFVALMLPAVLWASTYGVTALLDLDKFLALAALVYTALSFSVGLVSGWRDEQSSR